MTSALTKTEPNNSQLKSFFEYQGIDASDQTINRLSSLEIYIEKLAKEENDLSQQLNLVRYRKGEAISEFIENMPRGFWTNWLIFKIFGQVMLQTELDKDQKKVLDSQKTRLDNYRVLFTTANYSLAIFSQLKGEPVSIEEFLGTSEFSKIASSVWYRLGRNIEVIEKQNFEQIIRHIEAGQTITVKDVKSFQQIAKDPNISSEEKKELIKSILNKEVNLTEIKTEQTKPENDLFPTESARILDDKVIKVIDVEYTASIDEKQNSSNTYSDGVADQGYRQEYRKIEETPEQNLATPPTEGQMLSVLKEQITILIGKNEELVEEKKQAFEKINQIKQDLEEQKLITAQKEKDIEDYALEIYELKERIKTLNNTELNKFSEKSPKELIAIAQNKLTTEEDIEAIAIQLGISTALSKPGKLRKQIEALLTESLEQENFLE